MGLIELLSGVIAFLVAVAGYLKVNNNSLKKKNQKVTFEKNVAQHKVDNLQKEVKVKNDQLEVIVNTTDNDVLDSLQNGRF